MEGGEEQNTSPTNGTPQTSRSSRPPQIAHMSLYERQAVQALQALQRQPNAAQYFQQLMLQQQINNAQLHNLAAVQQVNLSTTSAGGTMTRPHGPVTTTTALNQSVLLGGNSTGQGQMYLRVNRTIRAPLTSQFIFMPGRTATATVATVAQTQQQQQETAPSTPAVQSDNDQAQNLALHGGSTPRGVAIKSEFPERKESSSFTASQQQQQPPHQQAAPQAPPPAPQPQHQAKPGFAQPTPANSAAKTGSQATMTVAPAVSVAPSTSTSSALPIPQLLLSPSAPVILVPTTTVPNATPGYAKASANTQTLVVQPLQQSGAAADKGPVPIQPKTAQGHRLPAQLPPRQPLPILPAPPKTSAQGASNPPHIPVQLVGARQCVAGGAQAVALVQTRNLPGPENPAGGTGTNATPKPSNGSLKRKSDSDAPNETAESDPAPMKDSAPPLSPAPVKDSAPVTFSSPPALSLPLSRAGDKDRAPVPQAVVKPQVLTHLIEGFVIQEGAEPFPVAGLLKDRDFALVARSENGPPLLKCEYCESFAPASQFRGSKRFCSNTCAKRYNVSCRQGMKNRKNGAPPAPPAASDDKERRRVMTRRNTADTMKRFARLMPVMRDSESSHSDNVSSDGDEKDEDKDYSPSLSPSSSHSRAGPARPGSPSPAGLPMEGGHFLSSNPAQWGVEEVFRFISSLQGCEELAAQFLSQEIDGQALMLLREDHLISTMNIKLGPALKICASINSLRE